MGTVERRLVRLTPAAALTIVGTIVGLVVARRVFVAAHRPLSWAAAAVVAAVLLDPVVDRLAVHIRRVPAVLITFAGLAVLGVGMTYLVFDEVEQALDRLETVAPDAAETIEARTDRVGELARDFELTDRIRDGVERAQRSGHGWRRRAPLDRRHRARLLRVRHPHRVPHDVRPAHGERSLAAGAGPRASRSDRGHRRPGGARRPSRDRLRDRGGPVGRLGGGRRSRPCSTCLRRPRSVSRRGSSPCSPTSASRSVPSRCSC